MGRSQEWFDFETPVIHNLRGLKGHLALRNPGGLSETFPISLWLETSPLSRALAGVTQEAWLGMFWSCGRPYSAPSPQHEHSCGARKEPAWHALSEHLDILEPQLLHLCKGRESVQPICFRGAGSQERHSPILTVSRCGTGFPMLLAPRRPLIVLACHPCLPRGPWEQSPASPLNPGKGLGVFAREPKSS